MAEPQRRRSKKGRRPSGNRSKGRTTKGQSPMNPNGTNPQRPTGSRRSSKPVSSAESAKPAPKGASTVESASSSTSSKAKDLQHFSFGKKFYAGLAIATLLFVVCIGAITFSLSLTMTFKEQLAKVGQLSKNSLNETKQKEGLVRRIIRYYNQMAMGETEDLNENADNLKKDLQEIIAGVKVMKDGIAKSDSNLTEHLEKYLGQEVSTYVKTVDFEKYDENTENMIRKYDGFETPLQYKIGNLSKDIDSLNKSATAKKKLVDETLETLQANQTKLNETLKPSVDTTFHNSTEQLKKEINVKSVQDQYINDINNRFKTEWTKKVNLIEQTLTTTTIPEMEKQKGLLENQEKEMDNIIKRLEDRANTMVRLDRQEIFDKMKPTEQKIKEVNWYISNYTELKADLKSENDDNINAIGDANIAIGEKACDKCEGKCGNRTITSEELQNLPECK